MWATIYYGKHKVKTIFLKYEEHLHARKLPRRIDDILGLQICHVCCRKMYHHWEYFKENLPFGQLTWSTKELTKRTVLLDLGIRIEGNNIVTTTYQKPLNLYLYLPYSSNQHKLYK